MAELIEASRAEVAVAALCRRYDYPVRVERWLEIADELMEHHGFLPPTRRRALAMPAIRALIGPQSYC